jgi:anti-sigma regulatory factor (Ser/Thr protein kinase)
VIDQGMRTCELQVARDPALAVVVRIFVGGVAERWGVAEQVREDLRLAASELFTGAVESGGDGPVAFVLSSSGGEVTMRADGVGPETERSAGDVSWDDRPGLLRALFPDAEVASNVRITIPAGDLAS